MNTRGFHHIGDKHQKMESKCVFSDLHALERKLERRNKGESVRKSDEVQFN